MIRSVTSLREFDALAETWREVTTESNQTSPFLSHDWFACCWRTAGPNRRRELWLLEDVAGPIGLVPVVYSKSRVHGLPVRLIEFLGAPYTPFVDFPIARGADEVIAALLDSLCVRRGWDVFSLPKLRIDSATCKALEAALPGKLLWRVTGKIRSPYIETSSTWEEFLRTKLERLPNPAQPLETRIQDGHRISVEEHREVDPDGPIFSEVMDVSRDGWNVKGGLGIPTMQGIPRFFRELTRRASANGWLHLWILRRDGRAVATQYQIGDHGSVYALRGDFDSSLGTLSPGAYLNFHIAQALFKRRHVREYEIGPCADIYTLRWVSGAHEAVGINIYAPTAYGRLLHGIDGRLVPLARRTQAL